MKRTEFVSLILVMILAIVVFFLFAKLCYLQRGYWAVGGEIFIPMFIIGWGVYEIFKKEH